MEVRREILVAGIVQGVGFRPYVYRLASNKSLAGSVRNTPNGVAIEIQGPLEAVEDFVTQLPGEAPELAQITGLSIREIPCRPDGHFKIVSSHSGERINTLISPDVAVCADCLSELFNPSDRRYLYPFINCTNCGPRFTIVRGIPYDRPRTSMSVFSMCPDCQSEYNDPANRRFHAQPNACWRCGPQLELLDARGRRVDCADPMQLAAAELHAGNILALKGLGGFHLAVNALNSAAVERLRERKRRVEKPFAVMVPDVETVAQFCNIDDSERDLLLSRQRPIVLLPKIQNSTVAEAVAPRQADLGIFLPYTPFHHLLFASGNFKALVMTSGNLSEEPIAIANDEAVARLRGIADFFLVHNRDILLRCDDSVVRHAAGKTRQIRRSRGYVPVPIPLAHNVPKILAVGGELKNTVCLTRGKEAFLSQHIGDLENAESFDFFREASRHLCNILEVEPEIIAYDLHPDYLSTKWALAQAGVRLTGVQHHHAHIAACMAENHLEGPVIGFALDGAGYGTDGQIWGGEALIARYSGFERVAHFPYVPLPGGEAAIREPWRMAVSCLYHTFGSELRKLEIPITQNVLSNKIDFVVQMIERQINSPLTSSCGRLFDAVAALLGVRYHINYEAQAAIELEMLARQSADSHGYPIELVRDDRDWKIGTRSLFQTIVNDVHNDVPPETISRRFHNGICEVLVQLATQLREAFSIRQVCLSGGTFNNSLLLQGLIRGLEAAKFEVFAHSAVPAGDGGLSLGQAVVAAEAISKLEFAR